MLGFEFPKVLCEDRHIYRGTNKRRRLKGRMQSLVARVLSLFTPLRLVILFVKHYKLKLLQPWQLDYCQKPLGYHNNWSCANHHYEEG
jgi:hypothetical protein